MCGVYALKNSYCMIVYIFDVYNGFGIIYFLACFTLNVLCIGLFTLVRCSRLAVGFTFISYPDIFLSKYNIMYCLISFHIALIRLLSCSGGLSVFMDPVSRGFIKTFAASLIPGFTTLWDSKRVRTSSNAAGTTGAGLPGGRRKWTRALTNTS